MLYPVENRSPNQINKPFLVVFIALNILANVGAGEKKCNFHFEKHPIIGYLDQTSLP